MVSWYDNEWGYSNRVVDLIDLLAGWTEPTATGTRRRGGRWRGRPAARRAATGRMRRQMPEIRILDDRLVSQIAAGEVVERPASVVKELVENALDAGAAEIRIELEGGGKRRIRVADDGRGMDRDDALLAFDRHATSKIADFEDLERVASLGFRGEALASIAGVARVELTTAREPGDGTRVRIEGGRVRSAEPAAHPRGTSIEVASLFFNVPARRKFLKSPPTELRRAVGGGAGLRPGAAGDRLQPAPRGPHACSRPRPRTRGRKAAMARIREVFGAELTRHLVELPPGSPLDREIVWGYVGDPSTGGSQRRFVFVNRRLLRDRAVLATFYRAVREEWHGDAFPALFLFLDVPPELVDVNVHPQKSEVRFREPALLDRLFRRLRRGLAAARGEEPAPLGAPAELPDAAPLAWRGLGERPAAGEVREPAGAPHLAETAFHAARPASGAAQRTARRAALVSPAGAVQGHADPARRAARPDADRPARGARADPLRALPPRPGRAAGRQPGAARAVWCSSCRRRRACAWTS